MRVRRTLTERTPTPPRGLLRACAWCGRVELGGWVPLEEALARLAVPRLDAAGAVTHGICDGCLADQLAAVGTRRRAA